VLDSRQLRAFVALAKAGSFSRAGREISVSQSAVSHSVKALEDEVGCRLLSRTGKGVQVTPCGEHLLYYAERILGDMSLARQSLERLKAWGHSRLRVGTSPCIARYLLPKAIGRLRKDHHDLPVTIEAAGSGKCCELLEEGRIDFAIALQPERLAGVDASPLFQDELMWVLPPAHPWVQEGHVDRKDLNSQGLVLGHRCCPTFAAVERFFAREKIKPKVICEAGDVESQKAHVMEGQGVALLPLWTLRHEIALGILAVLPVGRKGVRRQWILLRAHATRPALLTEALLREVRAAAAELVSAD